MKIGVDAVLVGAWTDISGASRIVDVGTGCGVIALMCAQRAPEAYITAIDIDEASVREAGSNFKCSPWADRLEARQCAFSDFCHSITVGSVDVLVSNPPYFNSGVECPDSPRMVARHVAELSPSVIIANGERLLTPHGRISMIVPPEWLDTLDRTAADAGLIRSRALRIRGHEKAAVKRMLLEYTRRTAADISIPQTPESIPALSLEETPGMPTEAHRALCGDFYLKY